ncbi:prolyl oligopeptidase family serine peptidase [Flavihumibacter sp. R14]|nr:prolyl oligopeptidase family serine peptidase [Flavihumibacter soli]
MKMRLTILIVTLLISVSIAAAQQQEKSMVLYTNYLLYVPESLPANGSYPLLLFLHGSDERGSDLGILKRKGPPSFLDRKSDFPFIVVSPQCPENREWDTQNLLTLLDHIEATFPVDKNKIYVTGLSMGGFATWNLAQAAPERFAAIAPICGGGNLDRLCIMRDVPVWAFHGAKDTAVPFEESAHLVKRLQEFGSDVKFTLYPDAGHDSWTATYQNQQLYDWLLSKSRGKVSPAIDDKILKSYTGRYKYSNDEIMEVTYEDKNLYVRSSVAKRKIRIVPFTSTKFRIPGLLSGDGDMYFKVTEQGKVEGFTVGPCDHTWCPRIE